ncbi:DMT family transporter [Litorisediminicola beolgyonensis]|uniref:DMT family transporter n=1 Tax=Litorisediminicola beolgyonensis TaxID=1173614 RepID=A0ABW3ZIA0_9RHOB
MSGAARGHLAMLAFSALVAGSFSLGRMAAPLISPDAFNAVRFVIAGGIMLVWLRASGPIRPAAFAAPWRYLLLAGLFVFYFVTMFEGLKTAAPVSLSAVFTLTPVISAVFGWWLLRQATTLRMALALTIGGIGALWVVFRADWQAFLGFAVGQGETIYFTGVLAHALYTPLLKRLNRGESAAEFNTGVLVTGAVLLLLWGGPSIVDTDWARLPPIVWITLGYTATFATVVSFACLRFGAQHLPSAKVMAYTYLVPSWVLVWELALGNGTPAGTILVGVGLTAIALLLLLRDEEARSPRAAEAAPASGTVRTHRD